MAEPARPDPAPDTLVTLAGLARLVVQLGIERSITPERVRRLAATDPLFPHVERVGHYGLVPAGPALAYFRARDRGRAPDKWRGAYPWLREHGQELVDAAEDVAAQPPADLGLAGDQAAEGDHAQVVHAVRQARTTPHDNGGARSDAWLHATNRVLAHSSRLLGRTPAPTTPAAAAALDRLTRLLRTATPGRAG